MTDSMPVKVHGHGSSITNMLLSQLYGGDVTTLADEYIVQRTSHTYLAMSPALFSPERRATQISSVVYSSDGRH